MRINKEIIHDNKVNEKNTVQIVLDDDCNVPDSKLDVENIIREWGNVRIDNIRANGNKAEIKGSLIYALVYCAIENGMKKPVRMEGELSFDETINLSDSADSCSVYCRPILEDITIKTINTRKLNVKAVISLELICEQSCEISVGCNIEDAKEDLMLETRSKSVNYSCIALNMKDNLRIRENVVLPQEKAPMGEIIWYDVNLKSFNTRLTDEGVTLSGEIDIFIMYKSSLDENVIEVYETTSSYEGKLEVNGCNDEMISFVRYNVIGKNIEMKSNSDGENTECLIELVLDLRIKAYEDSSKNIVCDMYSPVTDIKAKKNRVTLRHLLIRSQNQCRAEGKVRITDTDHIKKICNVTGNARIDDITVTDKGFSIDGAVFADVFYIQQSGELGNIKATVPFSTRIDTTVSDNMEYDVVESLVNLKCQIQGKDELAIKGNVVIQIICFDNKEIETVEGFEESETSDGYLNEPGIVGYIAPREECIWDIAKKYHTTIDIMKICNKNLPEKCDKEYKVPKGCKLLLMKAAK